MSLASSSLLTSPISLPLPSSFSLSLSPSQVTGDFHVPMGATTFIALLMPIIAGVVTAVAPPDRVLTTAGHEGVCRTWFGFGTLARPGFDRPKWDDGWLVQLDDDEDGHRFAFVWKHRTQQPANGESPHV